MSSLSEKALKKAASGKLLSWTASDHVQTSWLEKREVTPWRGGSRAGQHRLVEGGAPCCPRAQG